MGHQERQISMFMRLFQKEISDIQTFHNGDTIRNPEILMGSDVQQPYQPPDVSPTIPVVSMP